MKAKRKSFLELVKENKTLLLNDAEVNNAIEERLEQRLQDKYVPIVK